MKSYKVVRFFLTFSFIAFSLMNSNAQNSRSRNIKNDAFKCGEKLVYRIHYGFIDAGLATIKIQDSLVPLLGRKAYHVVGTGVSTGVVGAVFPVDDRYETYIDAQAICPLMFIRRVNEGGFKIKQDMLFDQDYQMVNSSGKKYKVPPYIQDMLSAFYFSRTFDYTNEKPGKVDSVVTLVDDQIWSLKIKFVRRDTISSDVGKICCMVFEPLVQKGRIFKHNDDLQVWISDDKNHIPIRAQANILVGSIKLDIVSWSGLANNAAVAKK
ncbi:MAG TPA: DUF3108 domain-containing protein [Bacteroidia bacterium]|nr:DUF3108 domain-containing protein [Bacteroidia bacterium]